MNIGYDAKRFYHNNTGLGNYSRDLIRILSNFYPNNDYFLYNPKPSKEDRPSYSNTYEIRPDSAIWSKLSSIWRQGPIRAQVRKDEVDIYHGLSGELPRGMGTLRTKTVVTIHDLIFMRYPQLYSKVDRYIHLKKFKYAANRADLIIAISEQTKRDIIEYLDVPESKIKVVYQVCHPQFKIKPEQSFLDNLKTKYNLPEEYILNVGTIEERKNILSVIKALNDIKDIPLIIVGSKKEYYKKIADYIDQHSLQKRVIFHTGLSMEELAGFYRLAKVFVYPSLFEGFGIPIIEALYSAVPVLTSKGGCFPEAGGPNTIYVDPKNVEEISEQLNELLLNSNKCQEIKAKGHIYAQRFNDDVIANDYMSLYKSLI